MSIKHLLALALLIGLMSLSACGHYVDPKLQPYLDDFAHQAALRDSLVSSDQLTLEFSDSLDSSEAGECDSSFSGARVRIDQALWERMNESQQTLLVFHELGHCLLKRDHKNNIDETRTPVSIMYFSSVDLKLLNAFENDPDSYYDELFER